MKIIFILENETKRSCWLIFPHLSTNRQEMDFSEMSCTQSVMQRFTGPGKGISHI